MDIVVGHTALDRRLHEPAVAIGNFDGVHLGHQRLFEEVRRRGHARGREAVVLTFEPHPARVLAPHLAPPLVTTSARKLELIARAGIDRVLVEPFTAALAAASLLDFVDEVLVGALGAREVVVGWDFTFGRGRAGTPELLATLGSEAARGFEVTVVAPVTADGIVCSSTKVREFVLEGLVDGAALLLGRDHEVEGVVVAGAGRGRTIGVPTANLRPSTELVPAPGVYAGWAEVLTGPSATARVAAAINIGTNPTFDPGRSGAPGPSGIARDSGASPSSAPAAPITIEAHLLDFAGGSLLDARVRLGFGRRLRAEQRFPSVEALVAQIRKDIEATRAHFATRAAESP